MLIQVTASWLRLLLQPPRRRRRNLTRAWRAGGGAYLGAFKSCVMRLDAWPPRLRPQSEVRRFCPDIHEAPYARPMALNKLGVSVPGRHDDEAQVRHGDISETHTKHLSPELYGRAKPTNHQICSMFTVLLLVAVRNPL
jgi:hypothetical protein